jgi:hypothetical protein
MKKPLAILATVATLGVTTMSAPAQAGGWGHHGGWGPALGFGLAAGALTAGAIATSRPYYGPDCGYYGPAYYGPDRTPITGPTMFATVTGGTTDNNKGPSLFRASTRLTRAAGYLIADAANANIAPGDAERGG